MGVKLSPMDQVNIRMAQPDDATGLTDALAAAYAPYRGLPGLPDVTAGIDRDIADHLVWVAETWDLILGGVILSVDGETAHILNLGVRPEGSGQGLGKALLITALDTAARNGATTATLGTHRDMTATQEFYRRLGWEEVELAGIKVTFRCALSSPSPKG